MKKYKVTYKNGWNENVEKIIEANDYDEAIYWAIKNKDTIPTKYVRILDIEEIDLPPVYVDRDVVYSTVEEILTGNVMFVDQFGLRRFLAKYIDDICQDIRASANPLRGWCVDDVLPALKRIIAKKLEIED